MSRECPGKCPTHGQTAASARVSPRNETRYVIPVGILGEGRKSYFAWEMVRSCALCHIWQQQQDTVDRQMHYLSTVSCCCCCFVTLEISETTWLGAGCALRTGFWLNSRRTAEVCHHSSCDSPTLPLHSRLENKPHSRRLHGRTGSSSHCTKAKAPYKTVAATGQSHCFPFQAKFSPTCSSQDSSHCSMLQYRNSLDL